MKWQRGTTGNQYIADIGQRRYCVRRVSNASWSLDHATLERDAYRYVWNWTYEGQFPTLKSAKDYAMAIHSNMVPT
jgi:hypothetical protein